MPIKYIKNWELKSFDNIIDVRSPNEYQEDHIPNSTNLPVLNNLERKEIGKERNQLQTPQFRIGARYVCHDFAMESLNVVHTYFKLP